jgi:hypothetical protein
LEAQSGGLQVSFSVRSNGPTPKTQEKDE